MLKRSIRYEDVCFLRNWALLSLLNRYLTVFTAIETMYPVEWCFRLEHTKSCWFQWLFVDLAYYYSTLLVVSAYQDISKVLQRPAAISPSTDLTTAFSGRTTRYLQLTIELLQKRLDNPEQRLEDITVATVASLAMLAYGVGDRKSVV